MMQISDDAILRGVKNRTTYDKGISYYYAKRVNDFSFNSDSLHAEAVVYGSSTYRTKVMFNSDGSIKAYGCTCPFNESYTGFCKHTVATLKRVQEHCLSENIRAKQAQKNINELFYHFDRISDTAKTPLQLDLTLHIDRNYSTEIYSVSFELKIGTRRTYVVKNIKGFICSLMDETVLQFGKNFSFDPALHCFTDEDMKIINIIEEGYHTDVISAAHSSYYRSPTGILDTKYVHLTDQATKRLMDALRHRSFSAIVMNTDYTNVEIKPDALPVDFKLSGNDELLELQVTAQNNIPPKCIPLTRDGEYVFFDGGIYHLEETQRKYVLPFLRYLLKNNSNTIPFANQSRRRFISDILPYSRQGLRLNIDSGLKEKFLNVDLRTEAYLDRVSDDIVTCKVDFKYGDITVEPFSHTSTQGDVILLRDLEKENEVINLLEQAEFKVGKEYLFIDDVEKTINFVVNSLPHLQQLADVFYSTAFREFKVADKRKFKAGIGYNSGLNLLEITFDFEGAETNELKDIFFAIREKRKFFKLKNGAFLPLYDMDLENVGNVFEYTEMSENRKPHISEDGVIQVPVSRALYLNSELDDNNNLSVFRQTEFTRLVDNLKNPEEMEFAIPDGLDTVLRDYQKIGFQWLKTLSYYRLGGILADDMGLGKTLQTIAFVQSELTDNPAPALVIAPTSLVYNWQDEINRFAPNLRVLIISGMQKTRQALLQEVEQSDIVLTSYPLLRRDIDLYEDLTFSYCFLDEAQHIKNPESVNAKSVKQIRAKGYFALTGTPIENSLTELWSIFDFVMPGFLLSHSKFLKNYERPIMKEHDEKVMAQLVKQIRPFILRRMKKDVLKELPEKIETKMTAELTDEQKKLYLAYLENAKGEIAAEIKAVGYERSHIKILAALTRLRQICCHPATFVENYDGDSGKLQLLQEIVSDAVESGHRILVFSQFTSMLEIISGYLREAQINYFYLDGSTKAEYRHEMVKRFNEGENSLFLISLKAGGTGLNLTGADMVIHYDPWWNPAVEDQATDRAYRIGQQNVVQVFKLVTKGTIEEKIFAIQQQKKEIADAVIQPGETMINKLDPREIKALFDLD